MWGLEIVPLPDISLTTGHSAGPNSEATNSERLAAGSIPRRHVWAMLFSRTVLFAVWQSAFALGFGLAGSTRPWAASVPWVAAYRFAGKHHQYRIARMAGSP